MKNLNNILLIITLNLTLFFSAYSSVYSTPINQFINSVSPPMNSNVVVKSSNIEITFMQDMNGSLMTDANIKLFGYQTGLMTASLDYNSVTKTLTINPVNNFKNGEKISLTLTSGLKTIANESITPFVYSFRAKALGGTGFFTKSSGINSEGNAINSGDIDGDGDIDLIIDNKIFKNDGNALFSFYSSLSIGGRSMIADFDNDGDLDIFVRQNDDVYFMSNNGIGNFSQIYSFIGGIGNIGDLNGDGYIDISFFQSNRDLRNVLNINGILIPDTSYYLLSSCFNNSANYIDEIPMINDMDNDGDLDIVAINGFHDGNSITFYNLCKTYFNLTNNGAGRFTTQTIFSQQLIRYPPFIYFVNESKTFDYDNDGFNDMISPGLSLKNNGSGLFIDLGYFHVFYNSIDDDFNGDGYIDLITTIEISPPLGYTNNGDGTFTEYIANNNQFTSRSTSADFDNDGDIDIAIDQAGNTEIAILLNGDSPLPVDLTSFTSQVISNSVKLSWTTNNEQNNSGFEIQRSFIKNETQESWIKAGFKDGAGNSNKSSNYSYEDKNLSTGKYKYRLKQIDFNGNFEYFNLSNEVSIGIPDKSELIQNFPNPFNPRTIINYELGITNDVKLIVYDVLGNEVASLVNEKQDAGYYSVEFDGSGFASGIYYYRLEAGEFVQSKKMLLVK